MSRLDLLTDTSSVQNQEIVWSFLSVGRGLAKRLATCWGQRPQPGHLGRWVALLVLLTAAACGPEEDLALPAEQLSLAYTHPAPDGEPPWDYFLTSYGGPSDSCYLGTPACGGRVVDGQWWYATGAYSFGCQAKLELRANGKCVVVEVVDNGPASWVEQNAAETCGGLGYIIDASPLVSQHLYGSSSAGWSDCFAITVRPVEASTPTGPAGCSTTTADPPLEDPPAEDPPAEDPPAEDPPAEDPPAEDPPAEDPPAEDPTSDPLPSPTGAPQLSITSWLESIPGQAADFCQLDGAGLFDWWVGQETSAVVEVKNSGQGDARGTQVALVVAQPLIQIKSWTILSDGGSAGAFFSVGDDAGQLVPQHNPGPSFVLTLNQLRPGETKRITLRLAALAASAGLGQPPELRAWVSYIDGYYYKASYDGAPTNQGGSQLQNGGDLRCAAASVIFGAEICDGLDNDCDGVVDNGCSGFPAASSPGSEPYYPEPELGPGAQGSAQPLGYSQRQHPGVLLGSGCSLSAAARLPGGELGLVLLLLLAAVRRSKTNR